MEKVTTPCSEEQRNEWREMHRRLEVKVAERDERHTMIAYSVLHGVEYGDSGWIETAQQQAREALAMQAEVDEMHRQIHAHPYSAEVGTYSPGRAS